ncbi:uncharacterized protein BJ212DRAFT_1475056 [Suillus subaureus]|uniref:Uncharacterized protein n=1 Tax=Suillus subaureus TaxID=48587 RepID=A0A9P7ELS1_9AGAM|nr:uncharacterized protein BJ212DRAFT_1475056 [Suillus subaureus]KAG1825659.1 hypothetical protein BJ212DRAFT_1475056 [Suillus subaureus]
MQESVIQSPDLQISHPWRLCLIACMFPSTSTFLGVDHEELAIHNISDDGLDIDGDDLDHQEPDDEGSDYDYTGVEEEVLFGQEKNGSTESVVEELDNMFIEHEFDYEP